MKALKTLFVGVIALLGLAACDEATNEYHSTYFYPMTEAGMQTYADQTVDSIRVISYDSWSLSCTSDWLTVYNSGRPAPISMEVPAGYLASARLDLQMKPNTTGKIRMETLNVVSAFSKIGTITQYVIQYPFLNIKVPAVKKIVDNPEASSPTTTYRFELNVSSDGLLPVTGGQPTIVFFPYTTDATLSTTADWIIFDKTEGFTKDQNNTVKLTITQNKTQAPRTAVINLTSAGVTTPITVTQTAPVVGDKE